MQENRTAEVANPVACAKDDAREAGAQRRCGKAPGHGKAAAELEQQGKEPPDPPLGALRSNLANAPPPASDGPNARPPPKPSRAIVGQKAGPHRSGPLGPPLGLKAPGEAESLRAQMEKDYKVGIKRRV